MRDFSHQSPHRTGRVLQAHRLPARHGIEAIPVTNMAGPALRQNSASRKATVLRRRYMSYAYQLMVAASQMQHGQSSTILSPLLTDLLAYWPLDEASGTRFDSVGTNHLSDTGGVGSTIGKQGNAATGFGASTFLSSTSDNTQIAGDWTIALWFRTGANVSTNQALISRWGAASLDQEYIVYVHGSSFRFLVNAPSTVYIDRPVAPNTTYLGFAWHDATAGKIYVQLNDGVDTSDTVGVIKTSAGNTFRVGQRGDTSLPWLGNWIDEIGIWGRVLTPAERTQLYNGGAGITYPFR